MCINETAHIRLTIKDKLLISHHSYLLEVDKCIALEIMLLIARGVRTLECCCGHEKEPPWCLIMAESHDLCVDLGYSPAKEADGVYKIILRGDG